MTAPGPWWRTRSAQAGRSEGSTGQASSAPGASLLGRRGRAVAMVAVSGVLVALAAPWLFAWCLYVAATLPLERPGKGGKCDSPTA